MYSLTYEVSGKDIFVIGVFVVMGVFFCNGHVFGNRYVFLVIFIILVVKSNFRVRIISPVQTRKQIAIMLPDAHNEKRAAEKGEGGGGQWLQD